MNYLLDEGHYNASRYPLARLWTEARSARRRMVNRVETDAVVMQAVIGAALSKKGARHLKALLKKLRDSDGSGA